jgi:hypothetical protein
MDKVVNMSNECNIYQFEGAILKVLSQNFLGVHMGKVVKIEASEILPAVNHELVGQAIDDIRNAGLNATTAYLHLADTIAKWNASKEWIEIERILISEEILSDSVLKKLMLIGSNPVLMDRKNWTKLPLGYNHLYPFTQIAPSKLTELIEAGKIHNGLSIKESNELKEQFRAKKAPSARVPKTLNYTIKIKVSADSKNIKSKIKAQFNTLKNQIQELDESAIVELL